MSRGTEDLSISKTLAAEECKPLKACIKLKQPPMSVFEMRVIISADLNSGVIRPAGKFSVLGRTKQGQHIVLQTYWTFPGATVHLVLSSLRSTSIYCCCLLFQSPPPSSSVFPKSQICWMKSGWWKKDALTHDGDYSLHDCAGQSDRQHRL